MAPPNASDGPTRDSPLVPLDGQRTQPMMLRRRFTDFSNGSPKSPSLFRPPPLSVESPSSPMFLRPPRCQRAESSSQPVSPNTPDYSPAPRRRIKSHEISVSPTKFGASLQITQHEAASPMMLEVKITW